MTILDPDLIVRVRLFSKEEGGRGSSLPAKTFGCPFFFEDEGFDCRLLLDQVGTTLAPGDTVVVPLKFLLPEYIVPRLKLGDRFKLWDGKDFAEGEVLEVSRREP